MFSVTSISHTVGIDDPGCAQSHRRSSEQSCAAHVHSKWNVMSASSLTCLSLKLHTVGTPQKSWQDDPGSEPTWLISTEDSLAHVSPWKRSESLLVWIVTKILLYDAANEPTKRTRDINRWLRSKQVALLESDNATISLLPVWDWLIAVFHVMTTAVNWKYYQLFLGSFNIFTDIHKVYVTGPGAVVWSDRMDMGQIFY